MWTLKVLSGVLLVTAITILSSYLASINYHAPWEEIAVLPSLVFTLLLLAYFGG